MDDLEEGYDYPERVKFEIRENVLRDYISATDFLNLNQIDTVILQHEYGIFGGKDGIQYYSHAKEFEDTYHYYLHTVYPNLPMNNRQLFRNWQNILINL